MVCGVIGSRVIQMIHAADDPGCLIRSNFYKNVSADGEPFSDASNLLRRA